MFDVRHSKRVICLASKVECRPRTHKHNNMTKKTIWKQAVNLDGLNKFSSHTMVQHIGIEFTEYGDDYLMAKMPVDHRTVQPVRLLHGGASAALAETLGSTAGSLVIDTNHQHVVGVELNCSHVRSGREGEYVYAKTYPVKIGRKLQVWQIDIKNEQDKIVCVSRLTLAVIDRS